MNPQSLSVSLLLNPFGVVSPASCRQDDEEEEEEEAEYEMVSHDHVKDLEVR